MDSDRTIEGAKASSAAVPEPATSRLQMAKTEVGSVFVSNYPPFSQWSEEAVDDYLRTIAEPPATETPLGLYMHIPFCRKRCKFCYFRVYTDKNADEVLTYCNALADEIETYARQAAVADRPLRFVYFGGGTPSYIAAKHLQVLVDRVKAALPWNDVDEVTFECEPGTLSQSKLETIRAIGVTRLSLGVEHFDDRILELNGRAHVSKEIYRVQPWIQALDFDQLNIDLIAGMVGETWDTWRDAVQKAIDFGPDSVTIYQLELPFNTRFSRQYFEGDLEVPLADWALKREWHDYAFEQFAEAGFVPSSAYTMVRGDKRSRFVYRDSLWRGADMLGTGVSSFGHMQGIHAQNTANWIEYLQAVESGELPLARAFVTSEEDRLIRQTILQLKTGELEAEHFRGSFGVELLERFAEPFERLREQGMLEIESDGVRLTRRGLLQVDSLLPEFYAPEYRNARYT
jgi:oxygen-independent coproporphyrinogen-3 oxidase